VDIVRARLVMSPPLLADVLAAALDTPDVRPWMPGDAPALVTIASPDAASLADSRIMIVLSGRLDDPVSVRIDGVSSWIGPTRPEELHDLVLALAGSVADGASGSGSSSS
jgi:hypothetical protein